MRTFIFRNRIIENEYDIDILKSVLNVTILAFCRTGVFSVDDGIS